MSRIGKQEITVPEKVQISLNDRTVLVKGPKGELTFDIDENIEMKNDAGKVTFSVTKTDKKTRSLWGLTRTLINNMVIGVTDGFTKNLEFNGVGYKAAVKGSQLVLNLGYSHPINYELPKGIEAKVQKNVISISGNSKELVGFVAAKIRTFRPPEPYKGKGIKYQDEVIIRKAGKTGAK